MKPSQNVLSKLIHNENMDILLSFCPGCPRKKSLSLFKMKGNNAVFTFFFARLIFPIKVSFVKLHYNYEQFSVSISLLAINPPGPAAIAITITITITIKQRFISQHIIFSLACLFNGENYEKCIKQEKWKV